MKCSEKIILYIAASLDGFIARKNGDISWLHPFENKGEDYGYDKFYKNVGALIMGSKTYRQALMFGEWPFGDTPVFVLTCSPVGKKSVQNIVFYSGTLPKLIKQIKSKIKSRKNIWLVGGSQVVAAFMNEGLLNELMLFVVPVLLKSGIPLFSGITKDIRLALVSSRAYSTGIVKIHYEVK